MMEREVSDTEGVFSRRLSSNWAELPNTLRRRQKHRPEILSQFTDFSESSESELFRRQEAPWQQQPRRVVKRSELLRKFEDREVRMDSGCYWNRGRVDKRPSSGCLDDDYRKHYETSGMINNNNNNNNNETSRLGQHRRGKTSEDSNNRSAGRYDREYRSFSDEERKTNSPDSLLVKSSESESSSDEYGHTDDSGAFLEKPSSFDRAPRTKYEMFNGTRINEQHRVSQKSRFAKFFSPAREDVAEPKRPKSSPENRKSSSSVASETRLDVNKNVTRKIGNANAKRDEDDKFIESGPPKYEYENIPRIDVSKIDQKSLQKSPRDRQPTIEQLRMEAGCQLRNTRNSAAIGDDRDEPTKKTTCSSPTSATSSSSPSSISSPTGNRSSQPSLEELRLEGLIQDFYNTDQISAANRASAERKISKMETITEEKQDGSKLSVREILKRFEELRMQNEMQNEERHGDKTLNTIQETLKKLDEKVKSYQVEIFIKLHTSVCININVNLSRVFYMAHRDNDSLPLS